MRDEGGCIPPVEAGSYPLGIANHNGAVFSDSVSRPGKPDADGGWPPSPVFGAITGKAWSELAYRHLDHHLRQVGA